MNTFHDRERAFEAKYAHDLEMNFRADSRRAMWLGLWAGRILGKEDQELIDYARGILSLDLATKGHDEIVERVEADLAAAGKTPDKPVAEKSAELLAEARASVMSDAV